ncbi:MAG: hypothetical protein RXO36_07710 [Candidatus Nanopusillus acidilobi]
MTEKIYCKYCGYQDIQKGGYESKQISSYGIKGQVGKIVNVEFTKNKENSNSILIDTYYCPNCKKINVETNEEPKEILYEDDNLKIHFFIPFSFENFLINIDISESELKNLLNNLSQIIMKRDYKNYVKIGENPCKRNQIGFKHILKIRSLKIKIYILVELTSNKKEISVRIIYDGGKSIC